MLNPGTFIQNRYEIISKIGSGGMADVYKAKDHKLNRYVAIKVLKNEFNDDKEFISKFQTEAQSAAGLAHANIVNVYDVGEEAGINYFVMELVEGITLKQYIANKGRLSVREATSISLQICAGLEAAHNNGIIHRDVKPQNIMISTDGTVKVTDFGIARAASANTMTAGVMGSVHYSSPEQARGGYSDEKSDIYSLGITMYEMLTGHVPFDGDTAVSVALQHLQEEMPGPKDEVPEIPYSTNQIVLKCTQKSPDRRYSNMADLIRDLRESLVNPDGDFVSIPAPDRTSQTIVMSKDEMDQLKNEQRMPSYDESLNVGAAAGMNTQEGDESIQGRAYSPGSYYQKSQYQEISPGRSDEDYESSDFTAGYEDSSREYDPYYDAYDDPNDYVIPRDEKEDAAPSQEKEEEDYGMNPKVERAVTVGGTIVAVVVGCVFLALAANAFGILNFGGSRNRGETEALVEQTEKESAATGGKSTEKSTARESEKETEKETASGSFKLQDLSNTEQSQAQAFLLTQGLKPAVEAQQSDTVENGFVIASSPAAGSSVSEGDTVTLYVSRADSAGSSGEEEQEEEEEPDENTTYVDLWDLTGYTLERAEEALSMLGLGEDIVYESSEAYASGMIISTSAAENGGEVPAGSTVTLYVSTGP